MEIDRIIEPRSKNLKKEGVTRMKSLLGKLGVILIGLAIVGCAEAWGADWKLFGDHDNYLIYYNIQNITRPSKNIVRVWIRWDYTKKGVMDMVGKFGKKYENLDYLKYLCEINCVEKMIRYLSANYYDNKGKVILSLSYSPEQYSIVPESIAESLYKEVCK